MVTADGGECFMLYYVGQDTDIRTQIINECPSNSTEASIGLNLQGLRPEIKETSCLGQNNLKFTGFNFKIHANLYSSLQDIPIYF